jgi:hypothetical protein
MTSASDSAMKSPVRFMRVRFSGAGQIWKPEIVVASARDAIQLCSA